MKYKCLYYALLLSIFFSFNACTFFEDEVFDESAAIRLNRVMNESKESLISSENGWVMLYFANNKSKNYVFLMKFNSNGIAEVGAKHEYTEGFVIDEGCWDIVGDNGAVLTFNTYINNFTLFADPKKPGATLDEIDGVGLGGDYEFNIISITTDRIELKGKKRGTRILMYRSPVAQSQWESYIDAENTRKSKLFFAGSPTLYMSINDIVYSFSKGENGVFSILERDNTSIDAEEEFLPYVLTPDGIRFSTFFQKGDTAIIEMDFNKDNTLLIDRGESGITLYPQLVSSYVLQTANHYYASRENLGGTFIQLFDEIDAQLQSVYGAARKLNAFGFRSEKNQFYFLINAGGTIASFELPTTNNSETNSLAISSFDVNTVEFADRNATQFYFGTSTRDPIPSLKKVLKELQGEYVFDVDNVFTQSTIKYIKSGKTSDFLTVIRK